MTDESGAADQPDAADAPDESGAVSAPGSADAADEQDRLTASRRSFLRAGGFAAAGAAAGGLGGFVGGYAVHEAIRGGSLSDEFVAFDPRSEPGFDHLVVLMGENRSFDNLLGYLYDRDTLPKDETFEGLAFGEHSNPSPDGGRIAAHVYEGPTDDIMGRPNPDPGEEYPHVNTQLFNVVDPPGNAELRVHEMQAPFNAPAPGTKPTMEGFVTDYAINYARLERDGANLPKHLDAIMGGFSPEMLPVLSTLAKEFAVYDNWYAGVPSQTFCNRSFFHASTSHGFVTNRSGGGYAKWLNAPKAPTIFNRLEEKGLDWRIYFDKLQMISYTGLIHAPVLEPYWKTGHFATMEQFYRDVASGGLPAYSFIEPRMTYNHNDFHPPFGHLRESEIDRQPVYDSAVSDVRAGEALVSDVYNAIRRSESKGGSNALNTMLLITFDEHGGTYDHVPPPSAVPPNEEDGPGEMGFTFDRLGCRVSAIAVSAYTKAGTIIHDEMHHGSVIATLSRLHGLRPLTDRDAGANNMFNAVNLDKPRHPALWPHTHAQYVPPNPEAEPATPDHPHKDKPLSPPAQSLLGLLLAKYGKSMPEEFPTFADAYRYLNQYGRGLFGKQ
ncbi:alkaline phosphatase family protein [Plantibacter sp. YIM 135249]|uniref:alkaline phosphatase family protein n=1 Tax=Plantibacter sp. YIM 135249 TaxID=3423918 RepID=UPI003D333363